MANSPIITDLSSLRFDRHGAQWFKGAVAPHVRELLAILDGLPKHRAGVRIKGIQALAPFIAASGSIGSIAVGVLGDRSRAVRGILFDKSADTNWALGWHQDRTICVRERLDIEGFGPWTIKQGMQHVSPPFDLLSRMATLRVHLDDVAATNAPLLVAVGSHQLGVVPEPEIDRVVGQCGSVACTAAAGDVWLYATPILHSSTAVSAPGRRRVLQLDFSADDLPGALEWLGI